MRGISLVSLLVAGAMLLAACAPAATPQPTMPPAQPPAPTATPMPMPVTAEEAKTIVEIAAADVRFSTLAQALEAADLLPVLQGEGPFTVFAPTDEAFAKLPAGTVEALLGDIPQLSKVLLYHVVPGSVMARDVVMLSSAKTANGALVKVMVDGDKVMVNDAQVIITDIEASNGVIHVIDTVLLPPKSIAEIAVEDGRFNTLVAALGAADLAETLAGEGSFTVFAPTDEAFAKLPAGTVDALLKDIPQLSQILLYHVVEGDVTAADVVELERAKSLQGKAIRIKVEGDQVMVNDAQVILTDIFASNGVIHVIDSVILPPKDIVETAIADGRFTTLVAAVEAAGLVETLQGEGPFTVFAPTDEAFKRLPAGTVEGLLNQPEQLKDILLYHVVSGEVMAAEVVDLTSAETAQGEAVTIKVEDGKVFINEAQVIITDILTANGVIHVIDSVLLPPS